MYVCQFYEKNYLRFFMNCYITEIVYMNVCMSILRQKLFMIFYELLHYGNNMHECMYVNLKRIAGIPSFQQSDIQE